MQNDDLCLDFLFLAQRRRRRRRRRRIIKIILSCLERRRPSFKLMLPLLGRSQLNSLDSTKRVNQSVSLMQQR